jgi:hypothetical protein
MLNMPKALPVLNCSVFPFLLKFFLNKKTAETLIAVAFQKI